jgi:hypothetical protein
MKPLIVLILLHNTYQTLDYWPGGGYTPVIPATQETEAGELWCEASLGKFIKTLSPKCKQKGGGVAQVDLVQSPELQFKKYIYIWHCIQYLLVYSHLLPT